MSAWHADIHITLREWVVPGEMLSPFAAPVGEASTSVDAETPEEAAALAFEFAAAQARELGERRRAEE